MINSRVVPLAAVATAVLVCGLAVGSYANVNLEWRPSSQIVSPGETVLIGLYAVSDNGQNQAFYGMDVVILWDPGYLGTISQYGWEDYWFFDGFPTGEIYPINDDLSDGDAMYNAMAWPGEPVEATPQGLRCAQFEFTAAAPVDLTQVTIGLYWSEYVQTIVYSPVEPGADVKGTLGHADVTIVPEPSSLLAAAFGLGSLVAMRRRKL